jgi:hypothetical protein
VAGLESIQDGLQDSIGLQQNLPVVEAHHVKACAFQHRCTPPVLLCSFRLEVLATIDLDDQLGFEAGEVGEEWSDGMLSAELEAGKLAVAQVAPDQPFCVGGLCA